MNQSLALPIQERSQAGEARRLVAVWGKPRGWSEELAGRVALTVTELGNNLAIHTGGGTLIVRGLGAEYSAGVEIMSLDTGPGIANFQECLRDGYSTAGTAGIGLGAVQRASQRFAAHSQPGIGTAVVVEIWEKSHGAMAPRHGWRSGVVNIAVAGESYSGDNWAVHTEGEHTVRVMIADGIGHGEFAHQASAAAVEVFAKFPHLGLSPLLERMHDALRATRGAAVSIAEIDPEHRQVTYSGMGNVSGCILSHEKVTNLVSMNGAVGGSFRSCREFTYDWPPGASLVMYSDGIKSHWQLNRYAGLLEKEPSLIAGILYRDHVRGKDDATVLVVSRDP